MKPKHFSIPCSWEKRFPILEDQFLYVPVFFQEHALSNIHLFTSPAVFPKKQPVHIEFCSGNGHWILEKAKKYPKINWVAVEKRVDRVSKIWTKKQKEKLANLFIVGGEGHIFSRYYVAANEVEAIYINFPDPWPKKRHAKHRLVNKEMVEEMCRLLKDQGQITIVTDNIAYSEEISQVMLNSEKFHTVFPKPYYINTMPDYGSSFFSDLLKRKGCDIRYMRFFKK